MPREDQDVQAPTDLDEAPGLDLGPIVKGAVAGAVASMVASLAAAMPFSEALPRTPGEAQRLGAVLMEDARYLLVDLGGSLASMALCGYVAARLAGRGAVRHAAAAGVVLLVALSALVVLSVAASDTPPGPPWYVGGLLLLSVPAAALGGSLHAGGRAAPRRA